MALKYSLEYSKGTQDSVYIDLRENPPIFQDRISKEKYDILATSEKNDFLTTIFNVSGVVELATQAYSMWIMKSMQFNWDEVLKNVLHETSMELGQDGEIEEMECSASTKGPEDPKHCSRPINAGYRRSLSQGVTIIDES